MSWFVIDVEADGPYPGDFSMVSFGAVRLDSNLQTTFLGKTCPISEKYIPETHKLLNITREQHESYPAPSLTMFQFCDWVEKVNQKGRPIFVSDNPAFDYQFINYYLHKFTGSNIFGHSARRIGDLYAGMVKDVTASSKWKRLRDTRHTHNPVDDALGNAEALNKVLKQFKALPYS